MKTLGTAVAVLFAGLSVGAQALETADLCDIQAGAPVASYMAFVVDWNDFGATVAPGLDDVASVAPGLSYDLIDPIETSAMVAEIDLVTIAPAPRQQRPAATVVRPLLVAAETPMRPGIRQTAPVPMPWPSNLRGVWFIGSFR